MTTPVAITITGLIPANGYLVFASSTVVRDGQSNAVLTPQEIIVQVEANVEFSVDIPSTDDPEFSPAGWTWEVRPHFAYWNASFSVAIPYDAPDGEIWFSELVPVPPDGDAQLYALASHAHPPDGSGPILVSDVVGLQTALDAKQGLLRIWNGSAYVANPTALIYAGPNDPGSVPDGSIWIDTTP